MYVELWLKWWWVQACRCNFIYVWKMTYLLFLCCNQWSIFKAFHSQREREYIQWIFMSRNNMHCNMNLSTSQTDKKKHWKWKKANKNVLLLVAVNGSNRFSFGIASHEKLFTTHVKHHRLNLKKAITCSHSSSMPLLGRIVSQKLYCHSK